MKSTYLILTLLTLIVACKPKQKLTQQQKTDCERFHIGTFTMMSFSSTQEYVVTRDNKIQTEIDASADMALKIKWLNACTYELTPADGSKQGPVKITVELSNVRGDTCDYVARPLNPQYPTQKGYFVIKH